MCALYFAEIRSAESEHPRLTNREIMPKIVGSRDVRPLSGKIICAPARHSR